MAVLCHIACSLLYYITTFLSICSTDSRLMKCFLPGPSLIFLQIELELRPSPWSPSKTGGNSLKSLMKGMGGWEGRYSACFCFLISFARSLRNEQALMGEISHHLGSMGGLPPSWIAESGFQSGFVQGEGRDS